MKASLKIIAAIAALSPLVQASELDVDTTSGAVHGFYNTTDSTVRTFLGIPYAEAPLGDLRWAAPVKKGESCEIIDATSYGPTCPGLYSYSNESIWSVLPYVPWDTDNLSEDCLSVNIWAPGEKHPSKSRDGRGAAVMMFVYGGAFIQGSSAIAFYDGTDIVDSNEDVIVVTFKYVYSRRSFGGPLVDDAVTG